MTDESDAIQTYRGPRPICNYCGNPLKPDYETKRGKGPLRKRRATENEVNYLNCEWNEKKEAWYIGIYPTIVVSRKFLGTFGYRDRFCNKTVCAADWAVEHTNRQFKKEDL